MARTAGPHKKSDAKEMPAASPAAQQSTDHATGALPAQPLVKQYIVQCRYHINASLAYQINASTESDAEHIARLKFLNERGSGGRLDGVTAVEVLRD